MTTFRLGGWLLVAFVIVGLAFAAPVVSAHAAETTADGAPADNASAADWAAWMDAHMTEHMGSGSVDWMESHMGMTVDEMAQAMADDDSHRGMSGQGHC